MKDNSGNMTQSGKYYDQLATVYDQATRSEGSWASPTYVFTKIKKYLTADVNILDIGIGTGQSIEQIYQSKQFSSIQGVDVSENMLNICKRKYPDVPVRKISSMRDLAVFKKTFDIIICSGALEFIADIDVFFEQSCRLIGENGNIFFTYETLIDYHSIQQNKKSLTVGDTDSRLYVENFYTYRRRPFDILQMISKYGLAMEGDDEFVSYKKNGEKIIYHLVQAKRK